MAENDHPITIIVHCEEEGCERTVEVPWPSGEYASILQDSVCLDGDVKLPEGWWSHPGAYESGDNKLRCPEHSGPWLDTDEARYYLARQPGRRR